MLHLQNIKSSGLLQAWRAKIVRIFFFLIFFFLKLLQILIYDFHIIALWRRKYTARTTLNAADGRVSNVQH